MTIELTTPYNVTVLVPILKQMRQLDNNSMGDGSGKCSATVSK